LFPLHTSFGVKIPKLAAVSWYAVSDVEQDVGKLVLIGPFKP
jgi:hypothetical protein